ncbi:replication initiation protein [Tranquillimonas alkanivorans]|uniref:Initiator Replication protein n=1 Tax=Tranquillimonas alkanivorans TaxID=441119 RepID=A0A1I5WWP6_9RHOB|nr:replication initiation protein [Tranquillimonas alkanivorans]SFQ23967.1 Initiator Replication protein [Tranquillimonas alkanivorans]
MADELRVLSLSPAHDEAIKPSELIQITGHQQLTLNARRAITVLWHHAHRQGIEEGKDYVIELSELRPDGHKGSEMIEEAILSLMQTILTVRLSGGRTRRVQFLGGNDMDDPDRPAGVLTYSFDKRLVEILRDSSIWGKIALPVLMAFSSKYAISLYENASQWSNLSRKVYQDYSLEDFRGMLGVEDGKYPQFGALNKHVIKPAVDEINALAPFNISILPMKTGKRVTGIRLGWWRKNDNELKEAWLEAQRPKVGRRARISGRVEHIAPMPSVSAQARSARLENRRSPNPSLLEDE